jgi:agmatinase
MNRFFQSLRDLRPGEVAFFGLPFDANSSYMRGPAQGPARLREVLYSNAGNWFTELGGDLTDSGWRDLGDLELPPEPGYREEIEEAVAAVLRAGAVPLAVGGDHSVSHPLLKGVARVSGPPRILHFDAHGDLYDELDGNRYSHATPFARILEEGSASGLMQVGVRSLTGEQRRQIARFGVSTVEMREFDLAGTVAALPEGPVYLSLDIDVLDPAFAPGVSHHEPGGMSVRELLALLHAVPGPVIAADIVELNPIRDPLGITAAVAAKLLKEVLGKILQERR